MNPCHYPQVTRPRSRSPSPSYRHKLSDHEKDERASRKGSQCKSERSDSNLGHGSGQNSYPSSKNGNNVRNSSNTDVNLLGADLAQNVKVPTLQQPSPIEKNDLKIKRDSEEVERQHSGSFSITHDDDDDFSVNIKIDNTNDSIFPNHPSCTQEESSAPAADECHGVWRKRYRTHSCGRSSNSNKELLRESRSSSAGEYFQTL